MHLQALSAPTLTLHDNLHDSFPVNEPAGSLYDTYMAPINLYRLQLGNRATRTMLVAEASLSCLERFVLAPRHLSCQQWIIPAHAPRSQAAS